MQMVRYDHVLLLATFSDLNGSQQISSTVYVSGKMSKFSDFLVIRCGPLCTWYVNKGTLFLLKMSNGEYRYLVLLDDVSEVQKLVHGGKCFR
jgi:hypothetical protein